MELHRVYYGTPQKVSERKRLIDLCAEEQVPLYKAIKIDVAEVVDPVLQCNEILITHTRVRNDAEKNLALAQAGCSELVIVVEAVLILEEKLNAAYQSISNMQMYARGLDRLLSNIKEKDSLGSFGRLCFGIFTALKEEVVTSTSKMDLHLCKEVFELSCEMALLDHPDLPNLKDACTWSEHIIFAWSEVYKMTKQRHQKSHPFSFIAADIETAINALSVLQYVAPKYELLNPLIQATIPLISGLIKKQQEKEKKLTSESIVEMNRARIHFKQLFK